MQPKINLKQLEAALRWKVRKNRAASEFRFEGFTLDYEGEHGIFDQAQRLLPSRFRSGFADNEEGHLQMAEAMVRSLDRQQTTLEKYLTPSAPAGDTTVGSEPTGEPAAVGVSSQGESAQTMAGGSYSVPGIGGFSNAPNFPQTKNIIPTKPIEEGPATNKAQKFAQDNPATAKANMLNKPNTGQTPAVKTTSTSPKIPEKPNIKAFRPPANFASFAKNFGSRLGVFFQRNIGKHLTAGRIASAVSSGIGAIAGAGFGGAGILSGGIAGAALPSWVQSGGGKRFFSRLGNGIVNSSARLSSIAGGGGIRGGISKGASIKIALGTFLFIGLGAGLIGGLGAGSTQTGIATPSGTLTNTPISSSAPVSGIKADIFNKFGIIMNGFDDKRLGWAYDKFSEVSHTKFTTLVKGSVINALPGSAQTSCMGSAETIRLEPYDNEALFKYILIHELSHAIHACYKDDTIAFQTEHGKAFADEGGVTYYAENASSDACGKGIRDSEDYAEMIALYLNPQANVQAAKCAPANAKYTNLKNFPKHYELAKKILGDFR